MLDGLMQGMAGGAPSFKSASGSDAAARQGNVSLGFDNSGWTTSTGSSRAGAAVPWYVWAGAAALALLAIRKMK